MNKGTRVGTLVSWSSERKGVVTEKVHAQLPIWHQRPGYLGVWMHAVHLSLKITCRDWNTLWDPGNSHSCRLQRGSTRWNTTNNTVSNKKTITTKQQLHCWWCMLWDDWEEKQQRSFWLSTAAVLGILITSAHLHKPLSLPHYWMLQGSFQPLFC